MSISDFPKILCILHNTTFACAASAERLQERLAKNDLTPIIESHIETCLGIFAIERQGLAVVKFLNASCRCVNLFGNDWEAVCPAHSRCCDTVRNFYQAIARPLGVRGMAAHGAGYTDEDRQNWTDQDYHNRWVSPAHLTPIYKAQLRKVRKAVSAFPAIDQRLIGDELKRDIVAAQRDWLPLLSDTAPAPAPLVALAGPHENVTVCGVCKPPLNDVRFSVVKALIDVAPDGLKKDELVNASGRGSAVDALKALAKSDPDWAKALIIPGKKGAGSYRVRCK